MDMALETPVRTPGPGSPPSLLARLADALYVWRQRAATRYSLAELDERMLRDIGLSRADAQRETDKPFWRV
ncbi:MAG: DUF1127 domain-containing protein [Alphaproteobacteria bacterium]|nr:DUF1127 domain-containing protein [Alphaproteobacteria bacterium]